MAFDLEAYPGPVLKGFQEGVDFCLAVAGNRRAPVVEFQVV
jgi:hypothetical protein